MFTQNRSGKTVWLMGLLLLLLCGFTVRAQASWTVNPDGTYSYQNSDGSVLKNKWINKKYYVDSQGIRVTGRQKIGSKWYFFSVTNGKLQKNGWIQDGEYRYYASKEDGALYTKGICQIGKQSYLFNAKGIMQTGKCTFRKKSYYLNPKNGRMMKDKWVLLDDAFYYFDKDGAMVTGKWLSDYKYYVDKNGRRLSGRWKGARYLGKNGKSYSGLHKIDGEYYYFDPKTRRKVTNDIVTVKGTRWQFNDEGKGSTNIVPAPGAGVSVQPEYYTHPLVDDETLLSYIIYCEAGNQPYEGKLAIAYVILNRMYSKLFKASTIREVIYEKKQFNPTWDGAMQRVYKNPSLVTEECREAAKYALKKQPRFKAGKNVYLKVNGQKIKFTHLFFMTLPSYQGFGLTTPYTQIGAHVFFTTWR